MKMVGFLKDGQVEIGSETNPTEIRVNKKGVEITTKNLAKGKYELFSYCEQCGEELYQIHQYGKPSLFVCKFCGAGYLCKRVLVRLQGREMNPINRYLAMQQSGDIPKPQSRRGINSRGGEE